MQVCIFCLPSDPKAKRIVCIYICKYVSYAYRQILKPTELSVYMQVCILCLQPDPKAKRIVCIYICKYVSYAYRQILKPNKLSVYIYASMYLMLTVRS